jgi:predicted lipid-binding transport protein (Tim44 family)/uncharacterized membrane protein YgcG
MEESIKKCTVLAAILLVFLSSSSAFARGGGGCLAEGTPVITPAGTVAIETLRVGDRVWSISGEKLLAGEVQMLTEVHPDYYLKISAGEESIMITSEHPVMVGPGEYRIAKHLSAGEQIYMMRGGCLHAVPIHSIQRLQAHQPAYNLLVAPGGTFMPATVVVHNKGCFLPDSPILKSDGTETLISAVRPGDELLAYSTDGNIVRTKARHIIRHKTDDYVILKTDRIILKVTSEHPFYVGQGTFKTIDALKAGDAIFAWDGKALSEQRILSLERVHERVRVFNLQTDHPNTFFAGGIAVHNKGGGGGGGGGRSSSSSSSSSSRSSSSSGSSGSSDGVEEIIGAAIFGTVCTGFVVGIILLIRRKSRKSENLDYVYSPEEVAKKSTRTEKLLGFLSTQDHTLSPKVLRTFAESTFRTLQKCWEKRDYGPMKPLLMDDLFLQHTSQLQGLVRNHEINRIANLKVERVDLVNVRYTEKPDQREFTALITASAQDYYVDDRTDKFLRGDTSPAQFQEFWTFHHSGNKWFLREIEQTGESDILKDENFAEMLTDEALKSIYGETASKEGKSGPWLEKGTEEKATRIDRLLNFLLQTDKIWDRAKMLERARQVFLKVFLAQESGDPMQVSEGDLFTDIAQSLRTQIGQWKMDGITMEYRNICVRKVELILVRNFADPAKDEFIVRISAHAQKIMRRGHQIVNEQPYVIPFEEYWTFGRLNNTWKLKEVLPKVRGEKMITEENVDEDSSRGQMNWYYRQTRAT